MKKIIICLWALIVCCWGCEDYLSVKPSNVQAIRTYDEVKALLGGHLRMYAEPGRTLTWIPTLKTVIYSGI